MIRLGKPVKLLEWGEGTNTLNQRWIEIGKGKLRGKTKVLAGTLILTIELEGQFKKGNDKDDWIKVVQQGEGMTPASESWGEVAMGRVQSTEPGVVHLEIKNAAKLMK